MRKKRVIFSIMTGGLNPEFVLAKKTMFKYAKRFDADLYIITKPIKSGIKSIDASPSKLALYQKKHIKNLASDYEKILYLDADILITPNAENIFDLMKCNGFHAQYNEKDNDSFLPSEPDSSIEARKYSKELMSYNGSWDESKYYNAGVILTTSGSQFVSNINRNDLVPFFRVKFYEQTYFNYLVQKESINVNNLSSNFNFMIGYKNDKQSRFQASFIHYTGDPSGWVSKKSRRYRLMLKDYIFMYPNDLSVFDYCCFYAALLGYRFKRFMNNFKI